MSDQESNPKSRREVWLSVALAVARDGLAEPETLNVGSNIVFITAHSHNDVRDWCAALNFDDPHKNSLDGSLWGFGHRDGWNWHVKCHRPGPGVESSSLAEQVAAAILLPDAPELPAEASA